MPYLLLRQIGLTTPRKVTEHDLPKCIWCCPLQDSTQCGHSLPSDLRKELRPQTLEFISWLSILISFLGFDYSLWSVKLGDQQNYGGREQRNHVCGHPTFHLPCKKLVSLGLCSYVNLGCICGLEVVWNIEENGREPGIR